MGAQKFNFWGLLGSFWGHLGAFWGTFGAHLGGLFCDPHSCLPGPKIAAFHPKTGIWGGLGGILGSFRTHLGHLGWEWGFKIERNWGSLGEGFFGGPLGKVMFLPKSAQLWFILGHFVSF